MTVKTRITLFVTGTGFIASLLLSLVVFAQLIEEPIELLDSVLKEEATATARMLDKRLHQSEQLNSMVTPVYPYWIKIYNQSTHQILYQSELSNLIALDPLDPGSSAIVNAVVPIGLIHLEEDNGQEMSFRVRTYSIAVKDRTLIVQIARPMENLTEDIWELFFIIVSALVFSTLALIAISRIVATKILKPIVTMKQLAQDISERNLGQRIPTGDGHDEFSELSRTINRMLDRLQYSFARQRDFLYDTSHELKTPLTTMRLAIEQICSYDDETLQPFEQENLCRLNNQVLRMERLVKDLLKLSSLETLTGIDPKPVNITELLSSLSMEYRFLADANNIQLETHLPEQLMILGDADKLNRAFSNILDNALKYNMDGGRINLSGNQSDSEVKITISNTGPGVPADEIPKVFEQFYRVEKSRSIQYGGSGLGLTMVKKIVALHGGKINFESQQGAWTRVTICFLKMKLHLSR